MSSGSESDDDYVPGEPEQLSEEESADEETETQYENEQDNKIKKRKSTQASKCKKKMKTNNGIKEITENNKEDDSFEDKVEVRHEEEKKREDDLWAKFLEGTDTKPKTILKVSNTTPVEEECNNKSNNMVTTSQKDEEKERERRIFEFAGEKIVVENNVVVEKIKTSEENTASASKTQVLPSRSRGAGLSNVLDQLNKKNKLSTLEKSKLDWNTYKKDEGIEEEIVSHNKGKAGYLDRKDFLERTDVRQYELERDARLSRRSHR